MSGSTHQGGATTWDAIVATAEGERERRIAGLVDSMTLHEKVREMAGTTPLHRLAVMLVRYNSYPFLAGGNRRLGIPPIAFTDGPRGVALGRSTCFPVAMARGATWDRRLEERVGEVMGIEARTQGANFFGGVCINLPRHPGWGRAQETYGEDPYLLGEMGAAAVRGLQRHVMACAKHFACNSIEESRFFVDVRIGERTLREVYLPHFKRCVDEGVAAIMSAYNKVNGWYCAQNRHLLRDILKGDWGFVGPVMSDFVWGTRSTVYAALGGLDIEMPVRRFFGRRLERAVHKGTVPETVIDAAVTRILRTKARFATVGDPAAYTPDKVGCREHAELSFEAALKSMVLLKNDDGILPLRREGLEKLAVVGKLADRGNIGDRGSSRVRPPYIITPLQGIRGRAGPAAVTYESGEDLSLAAAAAREAGAAVVVVGFTGRDEGESIPYVKGGGDREDLGLRAEDVALIEAVAEANPRCIVVVEAGSAFLTSGWRDRAAAILVAWYPGMEGGNAIAALLFGEENPSGKLPVTFPESNGQVAPMDKKAKSAEYGYYHGYRLCDREGYEPAFPFGFGLHYTEYAYSNLRLNAHEIDPDGTLTVKADITNTGEMAGCEIVQLYVGHPGSAADRPLRELKGFTRVHTEPGETKTVSFDIKGGDLAYYDEDAGAWKTEQREYAFYVGSSSRASDLYLEGTFRVR
ncbi:MAG: glycoside hydrolase family 3 C-terminal domain-containing protein [Actinomycetota bacterium]